MEAAPAKVHFPFLFRPEDISPRYLFEAFHEIRGREPTAIMRLVRVASRSQSFLSPTDDAIFLAWIDVPNPNNS